MTDEEIKQKAEEWYKNTVKINEWNGKGVCTTYMPNATTGFIAGAKLMQKENDRLAKHILELQKDKGRLTDENNKLLDVINNQDVKIADLEKKVEQAKAITSRLYETCNSFARLYGYSLLEGDKKEIEQFISEVEK